MSSRTSATRSLGASTPKSTKKAANRSNGRGTLRLDVQIPGVGRIAKASGLTDRSAFKRLNDLVANLLGAGRLDILRAVKDGAITPMQLYDVSRRIGNEKSFLRITVANFYRLNKALKWWEDHLAKEDRGSDKHRKNQLNGVRRVIAMAPPAKQARLLVIDLPELARRYRKQCLEKKAKSEWAHTKTYLRTFIRDRAGPSSPVLGDLEEIPALARSTEEVNRRPQDYRNLVPFLNTVDPRVASTLLTMALTGMGLEEFFENGCKVTEEKGYRYITVYGRKRKGRLRAVPFVAEPYDLRWGLSTFRRHFTEAMEKLPVDQQFAPYDMRRTYAVALTSSGVDEVRHDPYLGHGPRTQTQKYQDERRVVLSPARLRHLEADGELLRAHFKELLAWAAERTADSAA